MKKIIMCLLAFLASIPLLAIPSADQQPSDLHSRYALGLPTSAETTSTNTDNLDQTDLTFTDPMEDPILILFGINLALIQAFPYDYVEPYHMTIQSKSELDIYVEMLLESVENHYVGYGFTYIDNETGLEVDFKQKTIQWILTTYSTYDKDFFFDHVLFVHGFSENAYYTNYQIFSSGVGNNVLIIRVQKTCGVQIAVYPEHVLQRVYVLEIDKTVFGQATSIEVTEEIIFDIDGTDNGGSTND